MQEFTIKVHPADHEKLATAIEQHASSCAKLHSGRRSGAANNSDKTKLAFIANEDDEDVEVIIIDPAGKTTAQIKKLTEDLVAELLAK
jgi:hypothetical protein